MIKKKVVFLPYDFDTAIGINNEGALVFSYNLEDVDQFQDADVFNGQQSVLWNNLRKTFPNEIMAMYQTLRSTGALSYAKVEQIFEDHQSKWPEAIFNEDAYFKYLLPLIEDGTTAYLDMAQGSKAEQRKWWLYNRFKYIDSKYNAGDAQSDVITLRGYAKANMTITPYADIYVSAKWGSYLQQVRGARGVNTTLTCPLDNVNDTEIMVYSASQLTSIGDLSGLKVGYADFASATKLQSIKLGSASAYYKNASAMSLSFGNNALLKTLDVRNCTGLSSAVDLSKCVNLEKAYFEGTNLPSVSLPDGGVLNLLHLPTTVTALIIKNQPSLTDFICQNPANISTLWLENVGSGINARTILNAITSGSRVRLFNFTWNLSSTSDVEAVMNRLDVMRGLDQNGDTMTKAQVYGNIHVPTVESTFVQACKQRYADITILYDHIAATLYYYDNTGDLLSSETITDGAAPKSVPDMSQGKKDSQFVYTFLGWAIAQGGEISETALSDVREDRNVYACYSTVARTFTVRIYNGSTLLVTFDNIQYGESVEYTPASTPVYNGDGISDYYHFTGWSESFENIQDDLDIYAVYEFKATYREILDGSITTFDNSTITAIASYAFAGLQHLTSVRMTALISGQEYAFAFNASLKTIRLDITNEGSFTFIYNEPVLETVILPKISNITLGDAFIGCPSLKTLRINKPFMMSNDASAMIELFDIATTADNNVYFSIYSAIKYAILRMTRQAYVGNQFPASSPLAQGNGKILVPAALVDEYKADSNWNVYTIEAIEDNPALCEYEL